MIVWNLELSEVLNLIVSASKIFVHLGFWWDMYWLMVFLFGINDTLPVWKLLYILCVTLCFLCMSFLRPLGTFVLKLSDTRKNIRHFEWIWGTSNSMTYLSMLVTARYLAWLFGRVNPRHQASLINGSPVIPRISKLPEIPYPRYHLSISISILSRMNDTIYSREPSRQLPAARPEKNGMTSRGRTKFRLRTTQLRGKTKEFPWNFQDFPIIFVSLCTIFGIMCFFIFLGDDKRKTIGKPYLEPICSSNWILSEGIDYLDLHLNQQVAIDSCSSI